MASSGDREPVYRGIVGTFVGIFAAMGWTVRTTGGEHVPESGGAVLATNHVGYLDFVMSGHSVRDVTGDKRLVRYAAKKMTFDHPVSGPLMRAMKHIPVDRYGDASATIDESVRRLEAGQLVGMFPEGTINRSFVPQTGKTGTVRMAQRAGVPIIPGIVWGSQRVWTKGRPRDLLQRDVMITVDWLPPLEVGPDEDPKEATAELMEVLHHGAAAAAERYPQDPAPGEEWWVPAHLGGSAPTPEEAAQAASEERARRKARREREAS